MRSLTKYCHLAYKTSAACLFIKNHRLYRLSLILSFPLIALYFAYMRVPNFDRYEKQYEILRYQEECYEKHGIAVTHMRSIKSVCEKSTGIYLDLREECIERIVAADMGSGASEQYKKCKKQARLVDYGNRKLDHSMKMAQYYAGSLLAVLCFIITVSHLLPFLYKCLKRVYAWVASGQDAA
jgi:hypothetical protein